MADIGADDADAAAGDAAAPPAAPPAGKRRTHVEVAQAKFEKANDKLTTLEAAHTAMKLAAEKTRLGANKDVDAAAPRRRRRRRWRGARRHTRYHHHSDAGPRALSRQTEAALRGK